jgi:hypothetical protein
VQEFHVVVHLLVGDLIQLALSARRVVGPGVEGAREVAVVAVAADDVRVERDELAGLEAPLSVSWNQGFVRGPEESRRVST